MFGEILIYFGKPTDFYRKDNFEVFVMENLTRKLREMGTPSSCRVESKGDRTDYHFPEIGAGVCHEVIPLPEASSRLRIRVIGTRGKSIQGLAGMIIGAEDEASE